MVDRNSGARAPAAFLSRIGKAGRGRLGMRNVLLGSSALIAAGLVANPAMAQTTSPAAGGSITRSGGSATDDTAVGGGVQIAGGSGVVTVNNVVISQTIGSPTVNALDISGPDVAFTGASSLSTTNSGGAAFNFTTTVNRGINLTGSDNSFTGSYGLRIAAPNGFVVVDSSGRTQTVTANGTAVTGFDLSASVNPQFMFGTSIVNGFATGVSMTQAFTGGFVSFSSTGGSINATTTGINANNAAGSAGINSQTAIVAPTGISATISTGATITTSGGGTINAKTAGTGTGILTSGGGAAVITQGAAIGTTTALNRGIDVTATGSGTAAVTSNAAITVSGSSARGINVVTAGGAATVTTSAVVTSSDYGIFVNTGGTGVSNITVGGAINQTTTNNAGIEAFNVAPTSVTNINADITGGNRAVAARGTTSIAAGVTASGNYFSIDHSGGGTVNNSGSLLSNYRTVAFSGALNNLASATITSTGTVLAGGAAVYLQSSGTLTNAGTITVTNANIDGVESRGLATINNTGSITGTRGVFHNSSSNVTVNNTLGTINGAVDGINVQGGGRLILTNTGTIQTVGGTGGAGSGGVYINSANGTAHSITNSGTINGGSAATFGYGVSIDDGALTLTNQSGGNIGGGQGAIRLSTTGATSVTLNQGSTVAGNIFAEDTGARTISVAGLLDGSYLATTGAGVDIVTLAATGEITGNVLLGDGDDSFIWNGGTLAGTLDGGNGTDTLTVALGAGVSRTLSGGGAEFSTKTLTSGNLSLTGAVGANTTWSVNGGNLIFDGTFTPGATLASVNTNGTVTIATGRTYGGTNIVLGGGTLTNNGTMTGGTFGSPTTFYAHAVNVNSSGIVNNTGVMQTGAVDYAAPVFSRFGANMTVNNSGRIAGDVAGTTKITDGIRDQGGSLIVNNQTATSIIRGSDSGIALTGSGQLTLTNSGVVTGGVNAVNSSGTGVITNLSGGIIGTGTVSDAAVYTAAGGTGAAITLAAGGTVTNQAGGSVSGYFFGVYGAGAGTLRVDNAGSITSITGDGVRGAGSGLVTVINRAGGTISTSGNNSNSNGVYVNTNQALAVVNAGTISSALNAGVAGQGNAGLLTVTNATGGTIQGGTSNYGQAVQLNSTSGSVLNNYGAIAGGSGTPDAINSQNNNYTVNLFAGSTLTGGILLGSGNDTLNLYNGRGTASGATVDGATGITLQNAGTLAAASFGAVNLGGGSNELVLRGTGDGTAGNGAAGSFGLNTISSAQFLTKQDTGIWTLTGASALPGVLIRAGLGAPAGTLIFNGTTGLTGTINVSGAVIRAATAGAFGTGTIYMIDPTAQYGATGTYANNIVLQALNPGVDPSVLQTFGTGITAALSGAITESNAGQPLVFSSVDANGVANAGTFTLTNTGNSWSGVTTINAGTTLQGAYNTISGSSIVDNGTLLYNATGTVAQAISGSGNVTISAGVTLTGANSWTGTTTISNGSTLTGTASSIAGSSIVNSNSGAFSFGLVYVDTVAGTIAQNISGAGTTSLSASGPLTFNGNITTEGTFLLNNSTGNVTLNGTRSGGTTGAIYGAGIFNVGASGVVQGGNYSAILANNQLTVNNLGSISTTGSSASTGFAGFVSTGVGAAITVQNQLTLTNGSASNSTASITGVTSGVYQSVSGAAGLTVTNYGSIQGTAGTGVYATSTGAALLRVTNRAGGSISGTTHGVLAEGAGALRVDNAGSITATNNEGIRGAGTGAVTVVNRANATIVARSGVYVNTGQALTLVNAGSITGTNETGVGGQGGSGLFTISNANGATIQGGSNVFGQGIQLNSAAGSTVNNYGTILGGAGTPYAINSEDNAYIVNLFAGSTTGNILLGGGNDNVSLYNGVVGASAVTTADPILGGVIALRGAGNYNAASFGTLSLGAGANTVALRGTGNGAANGPAGSFTLTGNAGLGTLTKQDGGTWTITGNASGAGLTQINAGIGGAPGSGGLLVFNNTSNLTSAISVNGAVIRATSAGAFGTGTITTIDPTIQYGATGTYSNNIVLNSVDTAGDPTRIQADAGVTATLTGLISQGSAGQPLVFDGLGRVVLTNGSNDYSGVTTITNGTVVESNTASALGSGGIAIQTGAVLQIDNQTGSSLFLDRGTYSGAGTLRFTGNAGSFTFVGVTNNPTTLSLASGGLIDIVSGTVNGSSNLSGFWTGNLADMTIAAGAIFDTVEGAVQVDVLNGAGILQGGYAGTRTFTLGVDNGSGSFTGTIRNGLAADQFLALTKVGTGTQTLSGTNTYTGATTISGGTLALSGAGAIANSTSVTNNATFNISATTAGATVNQLSGTGAIVLGAKTLTANETSAQTISGAITGTGGVLVKTGAGNLTLSGANTYTGGTTIGAGTLTGNSASFGTGAILDNAALAIVQTTTGTFANNVSGTGAITASETAGNTLTISGALTQSGGLTVGGLGTTALTNTANAWAGTTTINSGATLQGASNTIAGSGIVDNGALAFNQTADGTFSKAISGSGGLTKAGGAILTLTGASTYADSTSVTGGTLAVDGSTQSATNVASGAALRGAGSINAAVTIADGGTLIGAQGATLTMGSLGLSSGSIINASFSAPGGTTLFAVTGNLTLDGTLNVTNSGAGAFGAGIYRLISYGGTLTDNGLTVGTAPSSPNIGTYTVQTASAGQVNLVAVSAELLFWDGGNPALRDNSQIDGGAGTWTMTAPNWTDTTGAANGPMAPQPGFAVFQSAPGTVTVDGGAGAIGVTGMQFAVDGYRVEGDSIALADAATLIRVGDGTAPGAGYTATIVSVLTGTGGLVKSDLGKLVLTGANDYTGGTALNAGTLQLGDGTATAGIAGAVTLANDVTLDVRQNAAITGQILSTGAGTHIVTIAGTVGGAYDASAGTGVDNVTLAATGAMAGANLGGGNDVFVYQGGTFGGAIDGGSGANAFNVALGVGSSATIALGGVTNFGYYGLDSGNLTVTGTRAGESGFNMAGGTVLNVSGSFTGLTGGIEARTAGTAATVNLASGAVLSTTGNNAVNLFADTANIVTNAGTITSPVNAGVNIGGGTLTNSGAINGGTDATLGFGVIAGAGSTGVTVTNASGGTINGGGAGAVLIAGSGLGVLDLQASSTVNGNLVSTGSGARTVTLRGTVNGAYDASAGTGVDTVSIYSGSLTSGNLGAGDDFFNYYGGTISGTVDGSTGTDSLNADFGAGNSGTVTLANFVNFENIRSMSGNLTVTGPSASPDADIYSNSGTTSFTNTQSNTGDIYINGGDIRANTAGAFGTGTIHFIDPTAFYGATGTYANNLSLEVQAPASANPSTLSPDAGVVATLTGSITQGSGAGVDPNQPLVIAGAGTIVLTNTANLWSGTTTINSGATLQGASNTISGSNIVDNGTLAFVQSGSGTFAKNITGSGAVRISGLAAGQTLTFSGTSGVNGGFTVTDASRIANTGSISGVVALTGGGTVTNSGTLGAVTNSGSAAGTIANSGSITGGVFNSGAVTVTNSAGGAIGNGISGTGAATSTTIVNAGSVTSGASAVFVTAGSLNVTNQTGASIATTGGNAIYTSAAAPVTIVNSGNIAGNGTYTGAYLNGTGAVSITNNAGGTISGYDGVLFRNGTLDNSGTITGLINNGVSALGVATVNNLAGGVINSTATGGWAIFGLGTTLTATNAGTINAESGVVKTTGTGTFNNSGTINASLNGVLTQTGGMLAVTNTGTIASNVNGVQFVAGGTVTNTSGSISGNTNGILNAGGTLNLTSNATLSGGVSAIVSTGAFADTVMLNAGSSTSGAIALGDGADQLTLGGALTGNTDLGAGNDALTLVSGAAITGTLDGGADIDALTLSGTGNSSLDIGTVTNFESRAMNGTGTWTLTGSDASSSPWQINSGTLAASGGFSIGDASSVTIAAPATLSLLGNETIGALNGAGSVTLGANRLAFSGGTGSYAGIISGTGGLTIANGANATLSGANSYTGTTIVASSGTLNFGASNVLADASALTTDAGTIVNLGSFDETVASIDIAGMLNGTGTLTAATQTLRGATINANLGAGTLTNASGNSTLNGTAAANTVNINGGSLALGASDRLAGTAAVTVATGAALDLGANSDTVGTLALNGTLSGTGTLTAASYTLNGGTANASLGAGTLTNAGGASTLNGTAAAATVNINGGSLALGASDRLADTAAVTVAAGAALELGANSDTVGTLGLNGTLGGTGTLTAATYDLNAATVNGNLGAGIVTNIAGVSTLNGAVAAGIVNVQAGTLALGASDRLADNAALSVASGATFNLGAFNDTVATAALSGTLAGTGTLTAATYGLNGATVNANLGTGTLTQAGGTSTLNGTSAAGTVNINGGMLRLGANERLANSAALTIAGTAIFDLAGFTETVGTLNGSAGTLALGAGRLVLAGNGDSAFSGAITGTGSLDKQGTGRLTLAGTYATTGRFDVSAGTLAFNGTSAGGIRVQGGTLIGQGTLGGNLTIASGSFSPGGLVGAGNAIQPIGSFQAQSLNVSGGTLLFDFGGSNLNFASDSIRVTGPAVLAGGTVNVNSLSATNLYTFNNQYLIVQAGTLTGTFANGAAFANVTNDASLKWRLRYDLVPNSVVLQVQKQLDFATAVAGGSANQLAIGNALNGSAGLASDQWAATLNTIAALTSAQRSPAYNSLNGEAIADASTSTIMANTLFLDLLRNRIGDGHDKLSGAGFAQTALGDVRVASTQGNSMASRLAAQGGGTSDGQGSGVWGQAYGGLQRLSGLSGQANLETTVAGVAMGAEGRMGALTLGVAGGYSGVTADVDARNSTVDGRLAQAGGYVSYDDGAAFANLAGNYYWGKFDTVRLISLGNASNSANGNFRSHGYAVGATAGYRADLGNGLRAVAIVSATQTHDARDGFTERANGGLGLTAAAAERDVFTATGEVRLGQWIKTGSGSAMPYVSVGVRYNAGDLDTIGNMRFSGAPTGFGAFQVQGAKMSSLLATWGAGIDVKASDNVTLGVAVESAYSDRTREGRASMRLKIGF